MKPSEAFGVAVRITGLISLLYWLSASLLLFSGSLPVILVIRSVLWLVASIWLLRGAPLLVRFAYPGSQP